MKIGWTENAKIRMCEKGELKQGIGFGFDFSLPPDPPLFPEKDFIAVRKPRTVMLPRRLADGKVPFEN